FGHSMVESMAFGLPVAAADTSVNREVCGPGGVFFRTTDIADCAATISALLDDSDRLNRLRVIAREHAADFSWRTHSERVLAILSQLAAEGRSS
ncbi:MAG: glycosyltransferase, partial [Rhodothermales bacterium]|nr:glycosyltransferase [Rhodothermales bacterium]